MVWLTKWLQKAARVHVMVLKLLGPFLRILSYFRFRCPFENSSGSLKTLAKGISGRLVSILNVSPATNSLLTFYHLGHCGCPGEIWRALSKNP